MSQELIEFQGVHKSFGSVRALQDVSFAIREGETVGLLGPNGAGKSTVVSLLLGLRQPDRGAVRIRGVQPVRAVGAGLVGAMLQETGLPPGVRVRELVELYRGLYPNARTLQEIVAQAGLADILERRVERLSGGQRRRLLFALAIAGDPRILFLDEPTVAMDTESRRMFWEQIDALAQVGRTILFTTHYLEEADRHARRILLLHGGSLIADGPPEALRRGSRTVHFTTTEDCAARMTSLVPAAYVDGVHVAIASDDAEAVVRHLIGQGVPMQGLEITSVSLEAALLQLQEGMGSR